MRKKLIVIALFLGIILGFAGFWFFKKINRSNVKKDAFIYVPTGADFNTLIDSLISSQSVLDIALFQKIASVKKLTEPKPGKYKLEKGMSANAMVNLFRSGRQTPVKLTFNNLRNVAELAGKVSKEIEADSLDIVQLLLNEEFTMDYGFNKQNIIGMFIPNTYEMYWNTGAKKFADKMNKEYKKFWSEKRIKQARKLNMTPQDVTVLASIVQAEQRAHSSERPIIAGLYINRLQRNMHLQSDPTLVFASGDFGKKRVLDRDKEIDSPYNTYMYAGLPPGPINMPDISSIDAVLNYKKHNYLFMCAKEDFSGFHNFSTNVREHERYARKYRKALNKKKIWR